MHARDRIIATAFLFLIAACGVAYGQSADLLMTVSTENPLSLADAAALVGAVGGTFPAQTTSSAALDELRRIGIALPSGRSDTPVTVGQFSYLVMQVLDLRGGLFYSMMPGPRYAVHELVARGLLPASTHPGEPLSGLDALRVLGMIVRKGEW